MTSPFWKSKSFLTEIGILSFHVYVWCEAENIGFLSFDGIRTTYHPHMPWLLIDFNFSELTDAAAMQYTLLGWSSFWKSHLIMIFLSHKFHIDYDNLYVCLKIAVFKG